MTKEERLFAAIGNVDEALLERSERRSGRGRVWLGWAAGMAACLALGVLLWTGPAKTPAAGPEQPASPVPVQTEPPAVPDPAEIGLTRADGQFHLLQCLLPEDSEVQFSLYINEDAYYSYRQEGTYIIRPWLEPDFTPPCRMEISHMADTSVPEAMNRTMSRLANQYEIVEFLEGGAEALAAASPMSSPDKLYARDGDEWDDAQREVWFTEDGQGGVFVLEASYFLEAAEGHGIRFFDMAKSFTVMTEESAPTWMTELEDAALRLAQAALSDDYSGAEDLLAEDADANGYGEDVYRYVSISHIDYNVSGEDAPEGAEVSVQFRLGGEDAYEYLTMELSRQERGWRANWVMFER